VIGQKWVQGPGATRSLPMRRPGTMPMDNIRHLARQRFRQEFESLQRHRAFAHPLFREMKWLAERGRMTSAQFELFRASMLARIFLTIPSIAEHAKQAALAGDYEMFATVLRNLCEEGANGDVSKMHPRLAEEAFNAVAHDVFDLPGTTMKAAHDERLPLCRPLQHYKRTVARLYQDAPTFASLAQEAASGGDGRTGMMSDLHALFMAFRPAMAPERFREQVVPYFQDHLALDDDGAPIGDAASGVECEHGRRALADAVGRIGTEDDVRRALRAMNSFARVQGRYFDAMLGALRSRAT